VPNARDSRRILHSSDDGRALYEALGFQPTNEMRLLLDDGGAD
jgi:hypothetical protein